MSSDATSPYIVLKPASTFSWPRTIIVQPRRGMNASNCMLAEREARVLRLQIVGDVVGRRRIAPQHLEAHVRIVERRQVRAASP